MAIGGWIFCVSFVSLVAFVSGHGRMVEPAARNVMWRFGHPNSRNYDDMGLNCGGFPNQFEIHHGKCGVCGDPYQGPRDHEAGGKYARGVVVKQYPINSIINVTIELTSNHMGYFEFRLCPVNDPRTKATQACLDKNVLNIIGHGTRYYIKRRNRSINVELVVMLPPLLTCKQCVLQWKWVAGQSMGPDGKGGECMGCGNQEHFINCADIAIGKEKVTPLPKPAEADLSPVKKSSSQNYRETAYVTVKPKGTGHSHGAMVHTYQVTTQASPTTTPGYASTVPENPHRIQQANTLNKIYQPATESWYSDPSVNSYNNLASGIETHNALYETSTQSWNGDKDWHSATAPGAWGQQRNQMLSFMQMFPTIMENWEWGSNTEAPPAGEYQHQYQNLQSGLEPGEYPEIPEYTPPTQNNGVNIQQYSNSKQINSNQDNSYMRGFNDALAHVKLSLGLSTDMGLNSYNNNYNPVVSKIASTVRENQKKPTSSTSASTPFKCPDSSSRPVCKGINAWQGKPQFDKWCTTTCPVSDCPANFCSCKCSSRGQNFGRGTVCTSVDRSKANTMDSWCLENCNGGNCPENLCLCV